MTLLEFVFHGHPAATCIYLPIVVLCSPERQYAFLCPVGILLHPIFQTHGPTSCKRPVMYKYPLELWVIVPYKLCVWWHLSWWDRGQYLELGGLEIEVWKFDSNFRECQSHLSALTLHQAIFFTMQRGCHWNYWYYMLSLNSCIAG